MQHVKHDINRSFKLGDFFLFSSKLLMSSADIYVPVDSGAR